MSEEDETQTDPYVTLRAFQAQCAMGVMQILQGNRTAMITAHEFDISEEFRGDEPDLPAKMTVVQVSVVLEGGTEDCKPFTEQISELCHPYFEGDDSREYTDVNGVVKEITRQ